MTTRRDFVAITAAVLASTTQRAAAAPVTEPWCRRTYRWGQTNITEKDPVRDDIAWWREYWKSTRVQGVIINAGGIVAYYPSKYPLQHRAEFLGDRDLYGDLAKAAHSDGLTVIARMDSLAPDAVTLRKRFTPTGKYQMPRVVHQERNDRHAVRSNLAPLRGRLWNFPGCAPNLGLSPRQKSPTAVALDPRTEVFDNRNVKGGEFLRKAKVIARRRGLTFRWVAERGAGSHGTLYVGDRFTVVKDLKKELGPGLLADMCRQLGLRKEDL